MALKFFVAVSALLIATGESLLEIGWRRRLLNIKDKPTTCDIQDLTRPALDYMFPFNLSCNDSVVDEMGTNETRRSAVPGFECVYTYSCHFDQAGVIRRAPMVCGKDGEWEGEYPDCSQDHSLASSLLTALERGFVLIGEEVSTEDEEMNEEEERETKEVENVTTVMETEGGVKKQKAKRRFPKMEKPCIKRVCRRVAYRGQCEYYYSNALRRRFGERLRSVLNGFCKFCFEYFCNATTILI